MAPAQAKVRWGTSTTLTARAIDSFGNLTPASTATWTVAPAANGTVTPTAGASTTFSGTAAGTVTVSATLAAASGQLSAAAS